MDASTMTCRTCAEELVAGIRGELDAATSDLLARHLEGCPPCRDEDRSARRMADLLDGSMPSMDPSPEAWNRLSAMIDEETAAARKSRGRLLYPAAGGLVAAAACLLLFLLLPSRDLLLDPARGHLEVNDAPATSPLALESGDRIAAADLARAEVRGDRDADLTLAPDTLLVCEGRDRFRLERGRLLAHVRAGEGEFAVLIPGGEVAVTGTRFQVAVTAAASTVAVLEGEVVLRTRDERVRVSFGTQITIPRGGLPGSPVEVDPWRIRDWCSAPTARLEASKDRLTLTLANDTVSPVEIRPFHADSADYFLRTEGEGSPAAALKIQSVMVLEGEHRPGSPDTLTLDPGDRYRLVLDPGRLGLSRGVWRLRAVYRPYKDLPDRAWHGTLETEPQTLTIE